MNVNHKIKRYKIISESQDFKTPVNSMNSKGRLDVKLEFIYVFKKSLMNNYAQL